MCLDHVRVTYRASADSQSDMYPTADRLAHLSPLQRAAFAVSSRLISCLVTESLLRAIYLPLPDPTVAGFAIVFLNESNDSCPSPFTAKLDDIFAIIPLQHIPIVYDLNDNPTIKDISLLDPLDMIPLVLIIGNDRSRTRPAFHENDERFPQASLVAAILGTLNDQDWFLQTIEQFEPCWNPVLLWNKYANFKSIASSLTEEIASEITSSFKWQSRSLRLTSSAYVDVKQHTHLRIHQGRRSLIPPALNGSNRLSRDIRFTQFVMMPHLLSHC